jgi:mannosyltransferase OCH1-like enzyme
MLWLQGEQAAPELVRLNFRRWASLNPDYDLGILNGDDVDRLLVGFNLRPTQMMPQALSNVVRAKLLLQGGVWADATLFPTEPLDAWLPDRLKDAGFFAFERPGADRPLSTWFLAASPDHVMMRKLWA